MEQIERYLDDLSTRLRIGPDRTRRLLAEAEEHLHEAVAQEVAAGADAEAAERRAIERFGTVREVAAAANGSLLTRLGSLALGAAYLGVAGSLAVLAGTLLARLVAAATSASTTFGPPPGFRPTGAQVGHWLALHPTAHSWYAAATSENADDTLLLRSAFALLGLVVSLVVLRLLRRRTSPPAGGVVPAIGMTAFAGAGLLLLAGGIGNSATPVEWGRGLCFSDAAAALVAAAGFAVLFVRRVHIA